MTKRVFMTTDQKFTLLNASASEWESMGANLDLMGRGKIVQ